MADPTRSHGPRLFLTLALRNPQQPRLGLQPAPSSFLYSSFSCFGTNLQRSCSACYKSHRRIIHQFVNLARMPSQTPEEMFADKSYDGWEELSPRQKVERMFSIHKSGHEEGEDVSFTVSISVSYVQPSVRERHNYPVCGYEYRSREATKPLFLYTCFSQPLKTKPMQL